MPRRLGKNSKPRHVKRRVLITDAYIADIVEFIREWKGIPRWKDIVNEAERVCGHMWTRQSLSNHKDIVDAYRNKVSAKPIPPHFSKGDLAIMHFQEKVQQKEMELQRLRMQVRAYDELFVIYQTNAHRLGITPQELERPLGKVDRRR